MIVRNITLFLIVALLSGCMTLDTVMGTLDMENPNQKAVKFHYEGPADERVEIKVNPPKVD